MFNVFYIEYIYRCDVSITSRIVADIFICLHQPSSAFFEILEDSGDGHIHGNRFHFCFVDSFAHGPDPRQWNRPTHLGSFESLRVTIGCLFKCLSSNNAKANFRLVRFIDEISVEHGRKSPNVKHGCVAATGVHTTNGRLLTNQACLQ